MKYPVLDVHVVQALRPGRIENVPTNIYVWDPSTLHTEHIANAFCTQINNKRLKVHKFCLPQPVNTQHTQRTKYHPNRHRCHVHNNNPRHASCECVCMCGAQCVCLCVYQLKFTFRNQWDRDHIYIRVLQSTHTPYSAYKLIQYTVLMTFSPQNDIRARMKRLNWSVLRVSVCIRTFV